MKVFIVVYVILTSIVCTCSFFQILYGNYPRKLSIEADITCLVVSLGFLMWAGFLL